jgi:L-aspartate oxidase
MAYRAGAELRDMEFVQFHPTLLYIAGSSRTLVTEAVRGEGAHLVDRDGRRFMRDYDRKEELAPRDVVSAAIVQQMEATRHPCVFLELSHLDPARVRSRFPRLVEACGRFEIDATRERIPVRPGAHYTIGGVTVDEEGRSSLPGLWAAGEVAASGLHGANRLASNSLLEGLVYGARAGRGAAEAAGRARRDEHIALPESGGVGGRGETLDVTDIRNALRSLMDRHVGVRRDGDRLREARRVIDGWCGRVLGETFAGPEGWELQNMLTAARLVVAAALEREETRGVHRRIDHPGPDDREWRRHIRHQRPGASARA